MSNTLTTILHKVLAQGQETLREMVQMPRLVNVDFATDPAVKGATIDVPIPRARSARDVTPSYNQSAPTDRSQDLVQIQLNNWKGADFYLTDKEMTQINTGEHFVPMEMSEAIRAIANAVDNSLHAEYPGVYGYVGTAGTAPFSTLTTVTDARRVLTTQLSPDDQQRRIVMDPFATAEALKLAELTNWDKVGENEPMITGRLGRRFGFNFFESQNVTQHTAGTGATTLAISSTQSAGASTIVIAGTGTLGFLKVGDVFSIAGNTQTYTVTASVNIVSAGVGVAVQPELAATATTGAVVTLRASHRVNLAFHRNAFALATRPLYDATRSFALGSQMAATADPMSGIALRLEISRQNKQTVWDFDVLYGAKLVRPPHAVRIAG